MTDQALRRWLDDHVNLERGVGRPANVARAEAPTLDRIRELTALLGSPQLDFEAIHLTGTNGKTSTARITAAILRAAGSKVGTYTSPNLERINDRMTIDGDEITDARLDELLATVRLVEPHLQQPPSYFEIFTAAAFYWFADEAIDVGVVEVGLGGTWDATNIIDASVSVVTNVALDHVEYLGPDRHSIAREKSGIVVPGSTLVLGETDPDLYEVFAAREPERIVLRDRDFAVLANDLAVGGRLLDLRTPRARYDDVFLGLHGAHQADNAIVALVAAEAHLDDEIPDDVVRTALATVVSPGRLEVVARQPLVVLDGAHNVAGAECLRAALATDFVPAPRTLVVGLLAEKDPVEMLTALGIDDVAHLVICPAPSPRSHDPETIALAAEQLGFPVDSIEVTASVREAVGAAMLATPDQGQVVVTGSLYVVGAARSMFAAGR